MTTIPVAIATTDALMGWAPTAFVLALKSVVVMVGAFAASLALRRASAAARHMVWALAVGALLALPMLVLTLPAWQTAVPWPQLGQPSGIPSEGGGDVEGPAPQDMRAVGADPVAAPVANETVGEAAGTGPGEPVISAPGASAIVDEGSSRGLVPSANRSRDARPAEPAGVPVGAFVGASRGAAWYRPMWSAVVIPLWAAGTVILLGGLLLHIVRLRLTYRRARPLTAGPIAALTERLATELRIPHVRVLEGPEDAVPMTWGLVRPVVLVPSVATDWTVERLRTVLLHELAHVRRRDYAVHLAAELACALYWFNPLVWWAVKRLRVEREHACDDAVIRAGVRASTYAQDLLDIALSLRAGRGVTALSMARPSQLHGRLLALLDAERSRAGLRRRLTMPACALAAALVLPLAAAEPGPAPSDESAAARELGRDAVPDRESAAGQEVNASGRAGRQTQAATGEVIAGLPIGTGDRLAVTNGPSPANGQLPSGPAANAFATSICWETAGGNVSTQHTVNDGVRVLRISARDCSAEIHVEGELRFTPDFAGITWISPGGVFRALEEERGSRREIVARPATNGVDFAWYVDGRNQPFDAEAEGWLSEALLVFFRRTGYAAEERIEWLLGQGGPSAVLDEIGLLQSNSVRRAYAEGLMGRQTLDSATLVRLMRDASRQITSNSQLAAVLTTVAERYALEGEVAAAFVDATGAISSNSHRANLLVSLAERHRLEGEIAAAYLDVARGISSNSQRRRALAAAISGSEPSPELVVEVLRSAEEISSNTQKRDLLLDIAQRYPLQGAVADAYLRTANTITSSTSLRQVLSPLLEPATSDSEYVVAVLGSAGGISSSSQRAALLAGVARIDLSDPVVQRAYLDAVTGISSSSSKREALSAIVSQPELGPEELALVLTAARTISSNSALAELLVQIAENHRLEGPLRNAYLDAAESISSRSQYGDAINALLRQEGAG